MRFRLVLFFITLCLKNQLKLENGEMYHQFIHYHREMREMREDKNIQTTRFVWVR